MRWIARTTAAVTLVGALVCPPAPEAHKVEPARSPSLAIDTYLPALERTRIERDEIERILGAVDESAERFDIDPNMILAMIHVESRFDSRAVSSRGAMGLMQLRPATAREVAENLAIEWTTEERLFEPDFNILLGTCYLRSLLDRFEDRDLALAAYNWGPTRVSKLRRNAGAIPRRYPEAVSEAFEYFTAL